METAKLTSLQKQVVERFYGIGLESPQTFGEIAHSRGVSKQSIEQTHAGALRNLKAAALQLKAQQ